MNQWLEPREAANELGIGLPLLRKLIRKGTNPPPFVRPSAHRMLFERKALLEWQASWIASNRIAGDKV